VHRLQEDFLLLQSMSEETLENSQVRMQEFAIQGEADLEHRNIDVNVQSRISRFLKANNKI
jgi:hypothetical protein